MAKQQQTTQAMIDRQTMRGRDGKYTKGYQCEGCKKPLGFDLYFSDDRCNTIGGGQFLCEHCAIMAMSLTDEEYRAKFSIRK